MQSRTGVYSFIAFSLLVGISLFVITPRCYADPDMLLPGDYHRFEEKFPPFNELEDLDLKDRSLAYIKEHGICSRREILPDMPNNCEVYFREEYIPHDDPRIVHGQGLLCWAGFRRQDPISQYLWFDQVIEEAGRELCPLTDAELDRVADYCAGDGSTKEELCLMDALHHSVEALELVPSPSGKVTNYVCRHHATCLSLLVDGETAQANAGIPFLQHLLGLDGGRKAVEGHVWVERVLYGGFQKVYMDSLKRVHVRCGVGIDVAGAVERSKRWRNHEFPPDVNGDFIVDEEDIRLILELGMPSNEEEAEGAFHSKLTQDHPSNAPYFNVNGDNRISPMDAVMVSKAMNKPSIPVEMNSIVKSEIHQDVNSICLNVGTTNSSNDINQDGRVDQSDLRLYLSTLSLPIGDVNFDGVFDSSDIVLLFNEGQYEVPYQSTTTYTNGDFNCDGKFDSNDFVYLFAVR